MENIDKKVKISIGLPVYNGERFIQKKIESILSQTFKDFELIISDNCSTDMTPAICENFAKCDDRIQFYRQKKNIGPTANFNFVLDKAHGKYFMWTAVDDKILPTFIEKNIVVLENNKEIICSTSQVKYYGEKTEYFEDKKMEKFFGKIKKNMIKRFTPLKNFSTFGTYERKIRLYLKLRGHQQIFYGIYHTDQIRKIFVFDFIVGFDLATILNALKYGDFFVLDEVLNYRYDGGVSSNGFFNCVKSIKLNFFESLFLYYPFTKWCWNNLGYKIFLRNIDLMIKFNLEVIFFIIVDIIRKIGLGDLVNAKK